jgi:hypothetical protein
MINHYIDRGFEKSSSKDKFAKKNMMAVFMKNSLLLSYLFTTALNKNRFEKKIQIKKKIYI